MNFLGFLVEVLGSSYPIGGVFYLSVNDAVTISPSLYTAQLTL
jgi:hypothetical protein